MKTLSKKELSRILEKHAEWLKDSSKGERANLSEADLSRANLSRANLSDAKLSEANLSHANLSKTILEDKKIMTFQTYKKEVNNGHNLAPIN